MMKSSVKTSTEAQETLAMPEDILEMMAALMGANFLKEESGTMLSSNSGLDWSSIPWEPNQASAESDVEVMDVDFSSFPSLSLDRSQEDHIEAPRETKSDVEAHVSALLSRPILVTSDKSVQIPEEDELEPLDFVASKVSEVPQLMLQNFFRAFTTLMNSRLRAYATFLARHGLALLETSSTSDYELEEGVVGVEQKLGTMLEIGRLVSTNAVVTSFHASKEGATRNESEEDAYEVSMPLTMEAAIDISLPRPWGGQSEVVTVSFQTTGTISGIFSDASGSTLMRVVGVDLDMTKLLHCMIEQAARGISCIVEMTNTIFSLSLPASLDEAQGATLNSASSSSKRKQREHEVHEVEEDTAIVSPSLHPVSEVDLDSIHDLCLDREDEGCIELSPEKCEHLVDLVLHEAPESILSPPSRKKLKIVSAEGAGAMPAFA